LSIIAQRNIDFLPRRSVVARFHQRHRDVVMGGRRVGNRLQMNHCFLWFIHQRSSKIIAGNHRMRVELQGRPELILGFVFSTLLQKE
jgi:hypothetical protein